jgi:CrcB protein
MQLVVVAVGGAIGAVARYFLGGAVQRLSPTFPYGTFVVNTLGCLAFGVIIGVSQSRVTLGPGARAFLFAGLLGGFTTFSSFSYESYELLRDGRTTQAAANIAGQVVLGLLALLAGLAAGRAL